MKRLITAGLMLFVFYSLATIINSILSPKAVNAADPTPIPSTNPSLSLEEFINRYMPNFARVIGTSANSVKPSAPQQLNEVDEDQDITIDKVVINKVIVVDPIVRSPMYYGLLTDSEGKPEEIIDNFDCEYQALSSAGKLNSIETKSLPIKTITYETDSEFSAMTVKKIIDIDTSVAMFSSRSFSYDGRTYTCEKTSTGQRFSSGVKTTSKQVGNYILQVANRIRS